MRGIDAYRVGRYLQKTQTRRRYENIARKRPDAIDLNKPHFPSNLGKRSETYPTYQNQAKIPFPRQHFRESQLISRVPEQVPTQKNLSNPTMRKALLAYQRQTGEGQQPSKMIEAFLAKGVTPGLAAKHKSLDSWITQKRKEVQKKELWKTYDGQHMVYVDDDQVATQVIGYKAGELISLMI